MAWTIDVDDAPAEATVDSGAASVFGIVENLLVITPDVDAGTRVAIGASIALWAVVALLVIGAVMFVASSFLRGRFFVTSTARAFDLIGWTIVLGGFGILFLENIGRGGVLAALGAPASPLQPAEFWAFAPAWAIGTSIGLVSLAFRRGIRLQHDTRGLV